MHPSIPQAVMRSTSASPRSASCLPRKAREELKGFRPDNSSVEIQNQVAPSHRNNGMLSGAPLVGCRRSVYASPASLSLVLVLLARRLRLLNFWSSLQLSASYRTLCWRLYQELEKRDTMRDGRLICAVVAPHGSVLFRPRFVSAKHLPVQCRRTGNIWCGRSQRLVSRPRVSFSYRAGAGRSNQSPSARLSIFCPSPRELFLCLLPLSPNAILPV
ncbi:MAG: hypothetical protein KatS3mg100_722 [Candidatus Parcubacteria bacterium]|nr:MAG: hypothetical protein KatS3mg100_722 [Candidatus Parcubacteria bacterium]